MNAFSRAIIPISIESKIVHSLKFPYLCTCKYFQLLDMKTLARNKHVNKLSLLVNDMFFIRERAGVIHFYFPMRVGHLFYNFLQWGGSLTFLKTI